MYNLGVSMSNLDEHLIKRIAMHFIDQKFSIWFACQQLHSLGTIPITPIQRTLFMPWIFAVVLRKVTLRILMSSWSLQCRLTARTHCGSVRNSLRELWRQSFARNANSNFAIRTAKRYESKTAEYGKIEFAFSRSAPAFDEFRFA